MRAHVGWYIWELMITGNWGTVHGVFYPDGTVRDPSIVAALMGFFRNRGGEVVEEVPDRENHVTDAVTKSKAWLADTNADWQAGLDLAETSANLLEAAQLVPIHDLPSRQVELLRNGQPDRAVYEVCFRNLLPCSSLTNFRREIGAGRGHRDSLGNQ
jgi:hypothetical protein